MKGWNIDDVLVLLLGLMILGIVIGAAIAALWH